MLRSKHVAFLQRFLRERFSRAEARSPGDAAAQLTGKRVLVLGIYLRDRHNCADHLVARLAESRYLTVEQRWAALAPGESTAAVRARTVLASETMIPKFALLNRLAKGADLSAYDAVLVTDDDITLPAGFLDAYLAWQFRLGLALAQPARAIHSFYDHRFTLRRPWCTARETRFVEIGPVFSLTRAAISHLLPFDERSPMGWGYDYVWPAVLGERGLRMGIIDATPVDHSHRPQGAAYSRNEHGQLMDRFLATQPHLSRDQAMVTVRHHW